MTELQNCRWVNSKLSFDRGETLSVGQLLELSAGEVLLTFDHGASVVIVGRVIFEIISPEEVFLTFGQLRAKAETTESHGFCVSMTCILSD